MTKIQRTHTYESSSSSQEEGCRQEQLFKVGNLIYVGKMKILIFVLSVSLVVTRRRLIILKQQVPDKRFLRVLTSLLPDTSCDLNVKWTRGQKYINATVQVQVEPHERIWKATSSLLRMTTSAEKLYFYFNRKKVKRTLPCQKRACILNKN